MHANLWNAERVWVSCFFFFRSFSGSHFSSSSLLWIHTRRVEQQACLCTEKTGLYFHTLPGGHQCSEGEGIHIMLGEVWMDLSQIWLENKKQAGIEEIKMQNRRAQHCFWDPFRFCSVVFYFVCSSSFLSLSYWPFFQRGVICLH